VIADEVVTFQGICSKFVAWRKLMDPSFQLMSLIIAKQND